MGLIINKDKLAKFNKFESDECLKEVIFRLTKKIEIKEESLILKDKIINKLKEQCHKNVKSDDNSKISQLQNEISKLKEEKKAKEKLDSGIKDIKKILKDDDSGFFDDDLKDNEPGIVSDLIKSNIDDLGSKKSVVPLSIRSQISSTNDYKNSERKNDEYLGKKIYQISEQDIEKQVQEQLQFLKNENKEIKNKNNSLIEQIKELLKSIKCDNKNKSQVSKICQILGYSPQTINKVIANNKKVII